MPLPESFLQELKMRSDLTELASNYISLKRKGRNMVGLCPFHGEKTPSFNIYTENNSFYCFGCGAGGDVITFIMKIENLDYIEAVKFLAERAGLNMPEESNYDDSMANLKKRIYEANRESARFFHRCLYSPLGKEGLDYLHGRGLSDKTIRHFGLGFAPNDHFALSNYLRKKGFKDSELVSANLVYKNKSGNGTNDRFYNRVMFPIIDVRGNVIAFGGRIMTDQKPKYLNTSDTPVFSKSNNLFSLNNAKKNQDRTLILCEGYMDVIAVNQAGFENAVATLGTALTSQQATIMKRYADDIIICYDADEAGQKATQRAIGILRRTGLNIRVLTVPDGKDPDEFIRKHGDNGGAAFYNLVNGSFNDVEYQLSKVRKKYDLKLADQRVKYVNEAINIIAKIDDDVERDVYTSKLADETGVHTESISTSLRRVRSKIKYSNRKEEFRKIRTGLSGREDKINLQHKEMPRATIAEEMLLSYMVNHPEVEQYIYSRVPNETFVTDFNRKLYSYFVNRIEGGYEPLNSLNEDFTSDEVNKVYSIVNKTIDKNPTQQALDEYISVIFEEKGKLSKEQIAKTSLDEFSQQINNLKKKRE